MQRWTKGYYAILIALSVKRANKKEESARYSIGFAHERVHFVAILGIFRSTHLQHELNLLFYKSLESLQRPSRDLVSVKYTIGYRSSVAQSLAFFCSFFMCRQHQTENSSTMCLYYGEWAREEVSEREKWGENKQSIHVLPKANKFLCSSSEAKYAYLLALHLICFSEIPFSKVIWGMSESTFFYHSMHMWVWFGSGATFTAPYLIFKKTLRNI